MIKKTIAIIIMALSYQTIAAQDITIFEQFVELESSYSSFNDVQVIGVDSIKLLPGFSYAADANGSMNVSLDVFGIVEPEPNIPASGEIEPDGELDASHVVGSIAGQARVGSSGGATYSIPIALPKGNKAMVPQIGVSYNSQSGNGLLGEGWNLNGLSSIRVTGKNKYYDGEKAPISDNDADCRVWWDGQRLFGLNGTGLVATSYATEVFSKHLITRSGSGDSETFVINTADGKILTYGSTSEYRMHLSSTMEWKWLLKEVSDRVGNKIKYTYTIDDTKRQVLLSKVEYGGSNSTVNEISFTYNSRSDIDYYYILDKLVVRDKLLDAITLKTNGVFVGSYDFSYTSVNGASLLNEVVQFDKDNNSFNPTKITWESPSVDVSGVVESTGTIESDGPFTYHTGDFTGDGISDMVAVKLDFANDDCKYYLYRGTSSGLSESYSETGNLPRSYTHQFWLGITDHISMQGGCNYTDYPPVESSFTKEDVAHVFSGDFDGDGIQELMVKVLDWDHMQTYLPADLNSGFEDDFFDDVLENIVCSEKYEFTDYNHRLHNYGLGRFMHFDKSPNSQDRVVTVRLGASMYYQDQYSAFPDLYSKGYNSFPDHNSIMYFDPATNDVIEMCGIPGEQRWGDFNGDGNVDYIDPNGSGANNFYLYIYNPTTDSYVLSQTITGYFLGSIDLNNDGTSAYVYQKLKSGSTYDLMVSHYGQAGPEMDLGDYTGSHSVTEPLLSEVMSADVDADGREDLLLFNEDELMDIYYGFTPTYSNGSVSMTWSKEDQNKPDLSNLRIGDFNGDGIADFVSPGNDNKVTFVTSGKPGHFVSKVTNGLGEATSYSYGTLTDPSVYTKGSSNVFPVINMIAPWYVVSGITRENGAASDDQLDYTYGNAKMHLLGKGFLGFMEADVENTLKSVKSEVTRDYDPVFFHTYQTNALQSINSTDVSEITSSTPSITQISGKRYKVQMGSTVNEDHQNNVTSTTLYTYNTDNQISQRSTTVGSNTFTEDFTYTSAGWHFAYLPVTVSKEYDRGTSITENLAFTYNSNGLLATKKVFAGTDREMLTSFSSYDPFGNPETITVTAKRGASLTSTAITTDLEYSSDGRFMISKESPLDVKVYYDFNLDYGIIESMRTANGFETTFNYGPFNSPYRQISPDLMEQKTKVMWTGVHADADDINSLFYKWSAASGSPGVYTFFDALGRPLRSVTTGFGGETIYTDTEYDPEGRISGKSLPYVKGDEATAPWSTITYNNLGRVDEILSPDGSTTSYTYPPLVTTTTVTKGISSQTMTTTRNILGEVVESKDALNNIVYNVYYDNGKLKETRTSANPMDKITMVYDVMGNRTSITDPDAGTVTSLYDGFGMLYQQTSARGEVSAYEYDLIGRPTRTSDSRGDVIYEYNTNTSSASFAKVDSFYNTTEGLSQSFTYEQTYGRVESTTTRTPEKVFTDSYTYDRYGRPQSRKYPSGFEVAYSYNGNGYMEEISGDGTSLWRCTDVNPLGQLTGYGQGTGSGLLTTTKVYDDIGRLTHSTTGSVMEMDYEYTNAGNMAFREDLKTNQKEEFNYDDLNRLTDVKYYLNDVNITSEDLTLIYDNGGNITSKSDISPSMNYGQGTNAGPNALTGIDYPLDLYEPLPQTISYTGFNKVSVIEDKDESNSIKKLEFSYGLGNQRIKTIQSTDDVVEKVKYFNGDYEEETIGSATKKYHYISAPNGITAIFVKEDSNNTMYHVITDHLGSISAVVNAADPSQVQKFSYSAWGVPRVNSDWTTDYTGDLFAGRGFTGHEHLLDFNLINMNGRVYDPLVGRFLSPDPFVQAPGYANSYNRYAYVMNNPLMYTDPSGYSPLPSTENQNWGSPDMWAAGGGGHVPFANSFSHMRSSGGWSYDDNSGEYYNMFTGERISADDNIDQVIDAAISGDNSTYGSVDLHFDGMGSRYKNGAVVPDIEGNIYVFSYVGSDDFPKRINPYGEPIVDQIVEWMSYIYNMNSSTDLHLNQVVSHTLFKNPHSGEPINLTKIEGKVKYFITNPLTSPSHYKKWPINEVYYDPNEISISIYLQATDYNQYFGERLIYIQSNDSDLIWDFYQKIRNRQ